MQIQDDEFDLVLFDLDGTLADTAPDMVGTLQDMQRAFGVEPAHYDLARANVSNGAMGLLTIAFPAADEHELNDLAGDYLERYAARLCEQTTVFTGLDALLVKLDDAEIPWGVVTNKPKHLTNPLLDLLGLASRSICAISGDTLAVRKPEPAPLLLGCDMANVEPHRSIYVGDAFRDIEAGRRAGMATVAAGYGYIAEDDDPREWDPDMIAPSVEELVDILSSAVSADLG